VNATVRRCFACGCHIDGRSAADYVGDKLEPFHPSCLAARKAPRTKKGKRYDWRGIVRAKQLVALAVGRRRLERRCRSRARLLYRVESEAALLGLPRDFQSGAR